MTAHRAVLVGVATAITFVAFMFAVGANATASSGGKDGSVTFAGGKDGGKTSVAAADAGKPPIMGGKDGGK